MTKIYIQSAAPPPHRCVYLSLSQYNKYIIYNIELHLNYFLLNSEAIQILFNVNWSRVDLRMPQIDLF